MKKQLVYIALLGLATIPVSCNDFLDSEPITEVSTNVYLQSENDLAAYAAKFYDDRDDGEHTGNILPSHGSGAYHLGLFRLDNGTDNQTSNVPSKLFVKGLFHVNEGNSNLWNIYMKKIRAANYFLSKVAPLVEQGKIPGNASRVRHYMGEVYFFRAYIYFTALRDFGDFPIVKKVVEENYDSVRIASRRRPRNEVARFILSDLDRAYQLMANVPPMANRLTQDCAALMKSRVALFEGTWEKYHRGTAFVPGDKQWPGANAEYLKRYTIDIDKEIRYFLQQAVEAADIVASSHSLYHDYAALFNSVDLNDIPEVLLWRRYGLQTGNTSHHWVVSYLQRNGCGNLGLTKSFVDSYLMKTGLPVYAVGSQYQGDDTYQHVFNKRDPRMDQTILKTNDLLSTSPNLIEYIKKSDGYGYFYRSPIFEGEVENSCPTGYSLRKGLNTDGSMQPTKESFTGCPVFRAAEAYLNYIEAYYELHGNLSGKCDQYWKALRTRAGMDADYEKTIAHTEMEKEKEDWGSYSRGKQISPVLYNIRRERRVELVAEGLRLMDLKRWRSLDQVSNYQVRGVNFWDQMYQQYSHPEAVDASLPLKPIDIVEYGKSNKAANISAKSDKYARGKYLLPYRKSKSNIGFDGLTWTTANYLYPISNVEFRLTTAVPGSNDYTTSSIYQNPYWSTEDGTLPAE